ncbi:hypothetical protein ZIOFF_048999 [Zingiber officinale]|uniref:PAP/OAS1 substrate-binding-related domain-containing protein n=1 Tax=Zingiber officinale TaxID=94328 RepID=A0A8J5G0A7_ZINOF|nr:hypothetical protein ZIOFF_048999 [Zingiber officinale]
MEILSRFWHNALPKNSADASGDSIADLRPCHWSPTAAMQSSTLLCSNQTVDLKEISGKNSFRRRHGRPGDGLEEASDAAGVEGQEQDLAAGRGGGGVGAAAHYTDGGVGEEEEGYLRIRTRALRRRRRGRANICQNLQVLPFGSVPLKTYLPDGDIDLTAINWNYPESSFAYYVFSSLKPDIYNKDSPFEVKDVQFIDAEVKLVKCFIENIVVDISFNQMGGLISLFFLETVRHILNLSSLLLFLSLTDPIGVCAIWEALYKFLDYFSKFNWENYALSLHGPVALSSLPNSLAVSPDSVHTDVLLSKESVDKFLTSFSLLSGDAASNKSSVFLMKYMNIVDPLKVTNNLGRSINKGNFNRILSAFGFGAQKLEEALMVPEELVHRELCAFFANSIERNKRGTRPNRQVVLSTGSATSGLCFELSSLKIECASSLVSVPTDGASGSKIGPESSNYSYRNAHLQNALKSQSMPCIDSIRREKSVAGDLFNLTGTLKMHVRYLEAWYGYEMMHGQFFMPIFQGSNDTFGLEPKLSTQEIVQAQEMDATYTCHSHGSYSNACRMQSQVPTSRPFKAKGKAKSRSTATSIGPNWHEKVTEASSSTAKLFRELDEDKHPKSTRTLSTTLFPQANGSMHQPKGRLMAGQPVSYSREYVRKPDTSKCQAMESRRTNQSYRPTQSYELKNDGDFPPLASQVVLKNSSLDQSKQPQSRN